MLSLQFPPKLQARTLRAAGLDVAALRTVGYVWNSNAWHAPDTTAARSVYDACMLVLMAQDHESDPLGGSSRRSVVICRTACECAECSRPIGPGEEVMQVQEFSGGTISTTRLCTCCWDYSMAG